VDDGGAYVLALAGNVARRRGVTIGLAETQWTEIASGLGESDRVVAAPSAGLADGAQVRVAQ
jgi:hypothetical protein